MFRHILILLVISLLSSQANAQLFRRFRPHVHHHHVHTNVQPTAVQPVRQAVTQTARALDVIFTGPGNYAAALQSARYRAANRITGHSMYDSGPYLKQLARAKGSGIVSGTSWSSDGRVRPTCYGTPTVCVRNGNGTFCTTIR